MATVAVPLTEREWLRPKEAAEYLGIALSTLYSWRRKGIVRFHRMGPRAVGLRRDELDAAAATGQPDHGRVLSVETVRRLVEHNERLRRKYGILPDSTSVIREARDSHRA